MIIVCESKKTQMKGLYSTGKYIESIAYTTMPESTYVLTIVKTGDNISFKTESNTYLGYTGTSNELYAKETVCTNNSTQWKISIVASGDATIENIGTAGRFIKYNASNPRFACYKSGQMAVQIYKLS